MNRQNKDLMPENEAEIVAADRLPKKNKKKKKHRALKIVLFSLLGIIVALIITVFVAYLVLYNGGKKSFKDADIQIKAPENSELLKEDGSMVKYKENKYVYNDDLAIIMFLGVDKPDITETAEIGENGQADAIYLIIFNTETKDVKLLAVSRETMVDVDLYSVEGNYYGVENTQVCLAYAYGDGKETSCENVKRSVQRILYNIPIHAYLALDMNGIPVLNDLIGGVTVPEYADDQLTLTGNDVTLWGREALLYLKRRNMQDINANNVRIEKHKAYIRSFLDKAVDKTKEDFSTPLDLFDAITDYTVTDVTASQVTYLAANYIDGVSQMEYLSIPGEDVYNEKTSHAEFYPDEEALYEMILDLFYIKQ